MTTEQQKTVTVEFLAFSWPAYNGAFSARKPGDRGQVTPQEAERLMFDFPRDFRVVSVMDGTRKLNTPKSLSRGLDLRLDRPSVVEVKYVGKNPTRFQGATIEPGTVVNPTSVLAAVLTDEGKSEDWLYVNDGRVSTEIPPEPPKKKKAKVRKTRVVRSKS